MDPKQRNVASLAVVAILVIGSWLLFWPPGQKITQGLDLQGGLSVILTAVETSGTPQITNSVMDRAETIVRSRVDKLGASEAQIQRQGQQSILVQLPGIKNRQAALDILGSTGQLEFVDVASINDTATIAAITTFNSTQSGNRPRLKPGTYTPIMTGDVITQASVGTNQTSGAVVVNVDFNPKGTAAWADYTTKNVGKNVAIVLDGVVYSAPQIREPITGGQTQIEGKFTADEAKQLKTVLETGALPVKLVFSESRSVGPTLGQDSLRQGLLAAMIGFALVAIYMVIFYRGLGLVTWGSLFVYASLYLGVLALLSSFGWFALSLPGIAGVVLTIGIAADSSILILERFREEVRFGKTYRSAAKSGTRHAIGTSADADIVTFVSAAVLFAFAIGPVKGFALTLMIGIVLDLFTAILFTRPTLILLAESVVPSSPPFFGVSKETVAVPQGKTKKGVSQVLRIPFMKNRWLMLGISATLLVVSIGAMAVRGLNFGIEFKGGTVVNIEKAGNVPIEKMRSEATKADLKEPELQTTANGGYIIRTADTDPKVANAKFVRVATGLGISASEFQVTTIGPGWGQNITNAALLAFALSMLAILLYISIRFSEWKMAIAAILALVHDMIITLGIYALFGFEVTPNTIAALLAILGYSLYDTIVVFHRIKENSQNLVKQSFLDMANDSINQVFTRSLNTSLTALIPVVTMLLIGGSTLKDFAFALTVGLICGAYSSIGVAAPIYSMWKSSEPKYKALAKKYGVA